MARVLHCTALILSLFALLVALAPKDLLSEVVNHYFSTDMVEFEVTPNDNNNWYYWGGVAKVVITENSLLIGQYDLFQLFHKENMVLKTKDGLEVNLVIDGKKIKASHVSVYLDGPNSSVAWKSAPDLEWQHQARFHKITITAR